MHQYYREGLRFSHLPVTQNKSFLSTHATGIILATQSTSLQASLIQLSYKQLFPFYR